MIVAMAPSTNSPIILGAIFLATAVMVIGVVTFVVRSIIRHRQANRE